MDSYAAGMGVVVHIPAQMRPTFDDQYGTSRIGQQAGNDRTRKARTNDQAIGAQSHFESVCIEGGNFTISGRY
jgi:hypothetical protein